MSVLKVIEYPNPLLLQKASPVTEFNEELKNIAKDMLDTMYEEQGIGLAGNQVAILKRIIVVDLQEEGVCNPMVLVNPVIKFSSDAKQEIEEGCLSLMPVKALVSRPANIVVEYDDLSGKKHTLEATDLLSTCLQHEIDHLNGILFVDHLSKIKKTLLLNKFKKLKKERDQENK